jgi:hypothetical protein
MDVEQILKNVDPNDGLTVERVDLGGGSDVSLHYAFREGGALVDAPIYNEANAEFWSSKSPDSRDLGDASRLMEVMKGVCRFFNTGGTMMQLMHAVSILKTMTMIDHSWSMDIPGFHLINTQLNSDGEYEHLFASNDGTSGIRWVEGRFIEPISLVDIANEMRKEASSEIGEVGLFPEAGAEPANGDEGEPSP